MPFPPILISSCIVTSDPSVKLNEPIDRLYHLIEGIENWLSIDNGLTIVICDGSNYDLRPIMDKHFPLARIECLCFQNSSDKVREYGKGYGEGEIVQHALENSTHLKNADTFIKCTSKLWVQNFKNLCTFSNINFIADASFSNIYNPQITKIESVDTRFYIVKKNFYYKYLIGAHLETSHLPYRSLENIFLKKILEAELKNFIFPVSPIICGVGGGSGSYYKQSYARKLKNFFKKGLLKRNARVAHFFQFKA